MTILYSDWKLHINNWLVHYFWSHRLWEYGQMGSITTKLNKVSMNYLLWLGTRETKKKIYTANESRYGSSRALKQTATIELYRSCTSYDVYSGEKSIKSTCTRLANCHNCYSTDLSSQTTTNTTALTLVYACSHIECVYMTTAN